MLSIISLDGTELGGKQGQKNFTDTTTFKLCIQTKQIDSLQKTGNCESMNSPIRKAVTTNLCPELKTAVESGKWVRSDKETWQISSKTEQKDNSGTRPLKSLHAPSCGIRMQVLMEIE